MALNTLVQILNIMNHNFYQNYFHNNQKCLIFLNAYLKYRRVSLQLQELIFII